MHRTMQIATELIKRKLSPGMLKNIWSICTNPCSQVLESQRETWHGGQEFTNF